MTFVSPRAWIPRSLLALGLMFAATNAYGDEREDEARAKAVFVEARDAYLRGDYKTACPKYEEVVRLRPGLGARVGLGDCYRKQGLFAKSWETYAGVVEDAAQVVATSKSFTERSTAQRRGDEAKKRMGEVEPEIGWLVVVVSESVMGLPELAVRLDGLPLPRPRFGRRLPADAGDHLIDANASGKKSWEKSVAIGKGAELTVAVQALEDEVVAKPTPTNPPLDATPTPGQGGTAKPVNGGAVLVGPPGNPPPDERTPVDSGKSGFFSTQRVLGLGIGAAGVGAVAVGAYFGVRAMQKRDESEVDGHCIGSSCDDVGLPIRQDAYAAGNVATGLFVGGGIAFAAGFALFLTAPNRKAPASTAVVVGPSSIHVTGRF